MSVNRLNRLNTSNTLNTSNASNASNAFNSFKRARIKKILLGVGVYLITYTILGCICLYLLRLRRNVDIMVYGRGPTAYITASILAQHGYSTVLVSPFLETLVSYYIRSSTDQVSIPYSLNMMSTPFRFFEMSPQEIKNLANHTGLSQEQVTAEVTKLFSRLKPTSSVPSADEVVSEFVSQHPNAKTIALQTYTLDSKSIFDIFPVKRSQIYKGFLTFYKEGPNGVQCYLNNKTVFHCRKLFLCDEFCNRFLKINEPVILSGSLGVTLTAEFSSEPFSKSLSYEDYLIDLHHTGAEMKISVSKVVPCIQMSPDFSMRLLPPKEQPETKLLNTIIDILKTLGDSNDTAASEYKLKLIPNWEYGVLPTGFKSTQSTQSTQSMQSKSSKIKTLGCIYLSNSRDPLRDSLLLAMLSPYMV